MNRHTYLAAVVLLLGALLSSCESSTTPPTLSNGPLVVSSSDRALFVVSEGNKNNGTLSAVVFQASPKSDTVLDSNIVSSGVFPNDVHILGNRAYVLENSGIIDVVSADSLTKISSINLGANGANKMAQIGATTYLVTQRNVSEAAIVDVSTGTSNATISVGENAAEVGVLGGKAYVTLSAYQQPGAIEMIDLATHQILKSRVLQASPEIMLVDSARNQLIIGSQGDGQTFAPAIYFLDPATLAVKDSLVDTTLLSLGSLSSMILGDRLYVLVGSDIVPVNLVTHVPSAPLVHGTAYYKGIYDAKNKQLYVGPSDFTNRGKVDVYNAATGKLVWSFLAGIAPGHFAFYH